MLKTNEFFDNDELVQDPVCLVYFDQEITEPIVHTLEEDYMDIPTPLFDSILECQLPTDMPAADRREAAPPDIRPPRAVDATNRTINVTHSIASLAYPMLGMKTIGTT